VTLRKTSSPRFRGDLLIILRLQHCGLLDNWRQFASVCWVWVLHLRWLKRRSKSSPRTSARPVCSTWCWPIQPDWSPAFQHIESHPHHSLFQPHPISNATFLPRDAMPKRGLCCRPVSVRLFVRPSVCLSRWCIVSTRLKISTNFFLCPVAHYSSFGPTAQIPNSKRNPFSGGAKYRGEFASFDGNRRLTRKRYEIGPWLLWNVNRKSQAAARFVSVSMTLNDP